MADSFFHVDQNGSLEKGTRIGLDFPKDLPENIEKTIKEHYSDGLSSWGETAIDTELLIFTEDAEENLTQQFFSGQEVNIRDLIQGSWVKESIFELVRMGQFPNRPSRFQSWFGTVELEEATAFADEYTETGVKIWEVEPSDHFIADMKLLDHFDGFASGLYAAEQYWAGETFLDGPTWEVLLIPPIEVKQLTREYDP